MILLAAALVTHAAVTGTPAYVYLYYAVAIVGGIGGMLLAFWKLIWPAMKRIRDFLTDWEGEDARPGVPARPGMMMRMETVEFDISSIKDEINPDHGNSMKDQINDLHGEYKRNGH